MGMVRGVSETKVVIPKAPVVSTDVRGGNVTPSHVSQMEREKDLLSAPVPGGKPIATTDTGNLTFHGGAVLKNPKLVPVYLFDYWATGKGATDRATLDTRIAAIVGSPQEQAVWGQYGAGSGSFGASAVIPGKAPKVVTQALTVQLLQKAIKAGQLDTSNPETVFATILPPGVGLKSPSGATSLNGGGLGGFHMSFAQNGKPVYFEDNVYSQGTNGIDFGTGNPLDNITTTLSHETTEAYTDPDVNSPLPGRGLAWYDDTTPLVRADGTPVTDPSGQPRKGKGEIGDITIINAELAGDSTLKSATERLADGTLVQKEWSNKDQTSV